MRALRNAMMITLLAALPLSAQRIAGSVSGVTNELELSAVPRLEETGPRRCQTLCTTAVGTVLGAGLGAGATYLYNSHKDPSQRSIADGPAVAIMAIFGGIVGAVAGFLYGENR